MYVCVCVCVCERERVCVFKTALCDLTKLLKSNEYLLTSRLRLVLKVIAQAETTLFPLITRRLLHVESHNERGLVLYNSCKFSSCRTWLFALRAHTVSDIVICMMDFLILITGIRAWYMQLRFYNFLTTGGTGNLWTSRAEEEN